MIHLLNPWILLAFPLPWLIQQLMPPAKLTQADALRVPFFSQLQQLIQQQGNQLQLTPTRWRQWLLIALWSLLVLAAAGPQWLGDPISQTRSGRAMMLAVDLSGSMQTPDMSLSGMQADRLSVVKDVAKKFIEQRKGDRLGLILFGSRAYLQTPLTFDRQTVLAMLDDATIGLAGTETAIGDAIGIAIKQLRNYPKESRVLVLLTDGANNSGAVSPLQAAKLAAAEGMRIYTIGVGADAEELASFLGTKLANPNSSLDEETLQIIAQETGGLFFRAKNTAALKQAYQTLDKIEAIEADKIIYRGMKSLYPWPLGLALLLSIALVWRWLGIRGLHVIR